MKRVLFSGFFALVVAPFALGALACGGSSDAAGAKSPSGDSANASGSSAPADTSGASANASATTSSSALSSTSNGTTTTLVPKNGGDLQGAKLVTSTSAQTYEVNNGGAPTPAGTGGNDPGRSRSDVQTLVAARRDEARKCYDDAFTNHPGIEGDIVITWKLDPKGVVTDAKVDDAKTQIKDAPLGACLVGIIKSIKFAASGKGFESTMSYPYNFHPHGAQFQQMRKAGVKP